MIRADGFNDFWIEVPGIYDEKMAIVHQT